jgi:hypothetical protein
MPSARSRKLRRWRHLCGGALLLAAYPAFVIGVTYAAWFRAALPGGRNGPADAYRHSLASAIVAYTLSPRCVDWVTAVMERGGRGSTARAMDAHNNQLGARIGATAMSWDAMQQAVLVAVENGAIDARSPDQITWLAPSAWQERLY